MPMRNKSNHPWTEIKTSHVGLANTASSCGWARPVPGFSCSLGQLLKCLCYTTCPAGWHLATHHAFGCFLMFLNASKGCLCTSIHELKCCFISNYYNLASNVQEFALLKYQRWLEKISLNILGVQVQVWQSHGILNRSALSKADKHTKQVLLFVCHACGWKHFYQCCGRQSKHNF